jgi:hypothetical protein
MIIHRGRRLGRQLHEGLANMPILKALALSSPLGTTASRVMWADLAKIPAIPTLEHLRLAIFDSDLDDYTRFILKHSKTLNILATSRMGLHSGTLADLSIFYAELSKRRDPEAKRRRVQEAKSRRVQETKRRRVPRPTLSRGRPVRCGNLMQSDNCPDYRQIGTSYTVNLHGSGRISRVCKIESGYGRLSNSSFAVSRTRTRISVLW